MEAIGYLSTFGSFRTRKESELICFGHEYAELEGAIRTEQRELTLRALLFAGSKRRQLFCNGVKKKTAEELRGSFTTVLFCLRIYRFCGQAEPFAAASLTLLWPSCGRAMELRWGNTTAC